MTKTALYKQQTDQGRTERKQVECRVVLTPQNAARSQSMTAAKVAKEVDRDLKLLKRLAF